MKSIRRAALSAAILLVGAAHGAGAELPGWMLGPFTRPPDALPIITPNPESVFDCPMRQKPVHWEATHTFNPAAVVKDGKVYILYRAEDQSGKEIGGYTSRLGLASSDDGTHFTRMPQPVLYPADDAQKEREWEGGCEDPRCVETEDGTYVLFYTQYHRLPGQPRSVDLGMATSRDLVHWTKTGPVQGRDENGKMVTPQKSASLVCAVRQGRVIATRINGRYWLYYGEGTIRLLSSENFRDWTPVAKFAMTPRAGHFDSQLAECGPPALLTAQGIVLLYNGKNASPPKPDPTPAANAGAAAKPAPGAAAAVSGVKEPAVDKSDPDLKPGVYADGQALFDANDPTHLLARPDQPFFKPEMPWEATGQYAAGTTFIEGLVLFHDQWLLYYGCADSNVGVAHAKIKPGEASPPIVP